MKDVEVFVEDYMCAIASYMTEKLQVKKNDVKMRRVLKAERAKARRFAMSLHEAGEKHIDSVSNVVNYYERFLSENKKVLADMSHGTQRD